MARKEANRIKKKDYNAEGVMEAYKSVRSKMTLDKAKQLLLDHTDYYRNKIDADKIKSAKSMDDINNITIGHIYYLESIFTEAIHDLNILRSTLGLNIVKIKEG